MRYRLIQIATLSAGIGLAVGLLGMDWGGPYDNATSHAIGKMRGELVDRSAPNFDLEGLDGQRHTLSEYRGEVIFLNFWASFCEPCRKEMPSMEALVRQYHKDGFRMVAISQDAEQKEITTFMQTFLPGEKSAMQILWDPKGEAARSYGTEKIPETYLIDRNGEIVARFVNTYDWSTPEAKALIETLLQGEKKQRYL